MEKEYEVVELNNGTKLAIIDSIKYQDRIFVLASILNIDETDISDETYIYEKINNEILIIDDNDLLEKLMVTFENRLYTK